MRIMTPTQEKLIRLLADLAGGDISLVEQALDQSNHLDDAVKYILKETRDQIRDKPFTLKSNDD